MTNIKNNIQEIAIAVIIYRSKLSQCNTYKTFLAPNTDRIDCLLIYDNSPESRQEDYPFGQDAYQYYWDKSNPGVSASYNKAARYAQAHGYQWLLLLDQDTVFPTDAMSCYEDAIKEYPTEKLFVPKHKIAGGKYLSPANACKKLKARVDSGVVAIDKYDIINSGMLIHVKEFLAAGGYKEEVSLDFSDFQFIERLRNRVRQMVILDMECTQDFSNEERDERKVIGRYKLFCKNVRNFETGRLTCKLRIAFLTLRHTFALCLRFHSAVYFRILFLSIFNKHCL